MRVRALQGDLALPSEEVFLGHIVHVHPQQLDLVRVRGRGRIRVRVRIRVRFEVRSSSTSSRATRLPGTRPCHACL